MQQKIKEIKNLSGDFKNKVQKEMDQTQKAVNNLQETLGQTELDSRLDHRETGPHLLRLAVDRQLYRQIDEENYLHQVRSFASSLYVPITSFHANSKGSSGISQPRELGP